MEEVFVTTSDNLKIALNHYKSNFEHVVILVHGWFMCKDSKPFLEIAQAFSKNFDVISMDCRGHGKSEGVYTFTAEEEKDLDTVIDYAKKHYKKIFLIGFSLGGALVLLRAAKDDTENPDITAVAAISPPCCFEKIENRFWHPGAWIPTLQKCELTTWFSVRANLSSLWFGTKPCPLDVVERIKAPTLFVAGEKDPTVFPWHTRALYEKAKCQKDIKIIENTNHAEDLFTASKEDFMNLCSGWFLSH